MFIYTPNTHKHTALTWTLNALRQVLLSKSLVIMTKPPRRPTADGGGREGSGGGNEGSDGNSAHFSKDLDAGSERGGLNRRGKA